MDRDNEPGNPLDDFSGKLPFEHHTGDIRLGKELVPSVPPPDTSLRSRRMIRLLAQVRRNRTARYIPAPIDVASLRKRFGMTQRQFARRFGFALATLRHWERGDRNPRAVISALRPCGNLGPANRSPT